MCERISKNVRIHENAVTFHFTFKPIFHQYLRWLSNANEIDINNLKCTWRTQAPMQGDPTRPIFHLLALGPWGLTLGPWGFALGLRGLALGPHVGYPKARISRRGSRPKRGTNVSGFALQWNIGFRCTISLKPLFHQAFFGRFKGI